MSWLRSTAFRLRQMLSKRRAERELAEELQYHIEAQAQENLGKGMSESEARRTALLAFGGLDKFREQCREAQRMIWAENLFADVRYALRAMRRSPGFTAVAITTLALGVGANSTIFSVANAMLFRRLPVRAPEQLVLLSETNGIQTRTRTRYQVYQSLRQVPVFAGIAATSVEQAVWIGPDHSGFINVEIVTGNYFETLGVDALVGRTIQADDDRLPGAHPVAVLSYAFWSRQFGADPDVIGRSISLAGGTFQVIGVSPPHFVGLEIDDPADIWVPLMMTEQVRSGFQPWKPLPRSNWLHLVGRLKPGVNWKSGEAAATLAYQQWRESADEGGPNGARTTPSRVRIGFMPAHKGLSLIRAQFSQPLLVLMVAVGFVLFVACINVATMLLARTAARQKEIATRLALGSSIGRLAQQFLVEGVLLALFGGLAGLFVALTLAPALLRFLLAGAGPSGLNVLPDLNVIGLTLAVSTLSGVMFGLGPALSAAKPNASLALKGELPWAAADWKRFSWRNLMVMAQIVLSLMLLIAAGLFVRTLRNLQNVDLGFAMQNVSLLEFYPPLSGYSEQDTRRFFLDAVEQLARAPGVSAVSFGSLYTFNGLSERTSIQGDGTLSDEGTDAETSYVGPEFFKTLGIPIVRGRDFTAQECARSEKDVAIVSQNLARRLFGDTNPIGRRIHRPPYSQTVIGVAADVRYNSLREPSPGIFYTPGPWGYTTLMVRTRAPAAGVSSMLRQEMERIDRRVPVRRVSTLEEQVTESLGTERLLASLFGAFGVLVSLLAAVGVYGVVSYAVNSRTGEFGIRMALGANRADVLRLVLRGILGVVGVAVLIGVPLALALTRFVSHMLYGLSPSDPLTLGVAVVMVAAAALIAGCAPAIRAARLDAAVALRRG
jgi:predicted permease